jgi:hypothetical protein
MGTKTVPFKELRVTKLERGKPNVFDFFDVRD